MMDGIDDNLELGQPPVEADQSDADLKESMEDPAGRSIGKRQEDMDHADSERLAEKYFPEADQESQDERIRSGMEHLGEQRADAAGASLGNEDYQSRDVSPAGDGAYPEEIPSDPVEAEYELQKQMENFEPPAGMGNAVESANNDPDEIQDLRQQFGENQEELDQLQSRLQNVTNEGIDNYMDVRQEPQEEGDLAGVVDSWAKSHGTESDMFTEEQKQEIDDLSEQIDELQQQKDELRNQIQSARREHYGYSQS